MRKMSGFRKLRYAVTFIAMGIVQLVHAETPPIPKKPQFNQLYISPKGVLVALVSDGIFRSLDDGKHWLRTLYTSSGDQTLFSTANNLILIDTKGNIYRSRNDGATWGSEGGLAKLEWAAEIRKREFSNYMALDKSGRMYVCHSGDIQVSENWGRDWHKLKPLPEVDGKQQSCQMMTANDSGVFALTDDGAIFKSKDGHEWQSNASIETIRQKKNARISFFKSGFKNELYIALDRLMYMSKNDGHTWDRLSFGLEENFNLVPSIYFIRPDALYITTFSGYDAPAPKTTIYRSEDGKSIAQFDHYYPWHDIQLGKQGSIYVVTDDYIQKTSDKGVTWKALNAEDINWFVPGR